MENTMTTSEKINYMVDKLKGYKERASSLSDIFHMDGYSILKQQLAIQFYNGATCHVQVADFGNRICFTNDFETEMDDLYNAFVEREPLMEEYIAKSEAEKRADIEKEIQRLQATLGE